MAYASGFEYDIYISYASDDAQWARRFRDDLNLTLRNLLGRDVFIFFDDRDLGTLDKRHVDERRRIIDESAVFLALLSPAYARQVPAYDELIWFSATNRSGEMVFVEISPVEEHRIHLWAPRIRFWVDP